MLRVLDPRFVAVERISSWISSLLLSGAVLVGLLFSWLFGWFDGWVELAVWASGLAVILLLVVSAIVYPPLVYRFISYSISPLGLQIRRGILWRHLIDVPRSRIQHTDVTQGPVQRQYGIATLVVYTAGTGYANVELSGLDYEYALRARDYLVRGGGEDAI